MLMSITRGIEIQILFLNKSHLKSVIKVSPGGKILVKVEFGDSRNLFFEEIKFSTQIFNLFLRSSLVEFKCYYVSYWHCLIVSVVVIRCGELLFVIFYKTRSFQL
eukprot:TRINITY_DN2680_c0_g1_i1.p1 TRINITY_DN2680_c0_g1~~TRINITY_DN2680_c0_g1_i1.p1  ORF type:complete len:105 (+),score=2.85 TRINITY_DN2680_c0_g1_i1:190-504(+)